MRDGAVCSACFLLYYVSLMTVTYSIPKGVDDKMENGHSQYLEK